MSKTTQNFSFSELSVLIGILIFQGRIPHPVILDDTVIDGVDAGDPSGGISQPVNINGWIFDGSSPIGAPMSAGVEALRQELVASGQQQFADKLPRHHVIRFWAPASATFSFAIEDYERFRRPADTSPYPTTDREWDQILDNIWLWMSQIAAFAFAGSYISRLKAQYRGQANHQIGWKIAAMSAALKPGGLARAIELQEFNPYAVYATERTDKDAISISSYYTVKKIEPRLEGHVVYDVWWNGNSDEDVTRYYREWAKAFGASIS